MTFRTLSDLDPRGKRILLRVDLNAPFENGKLSDGTRIDRIMPTVHALAERGGRVILVAHFGRPKGYDPDETLGPAVAEVAKRLGKPVPLAKDCIGDDALSLIASMQDGDVIALENTRFHAGEEKNDPAFLAALAANGDVYVNDAFSAAHRAHASTEGLARMLPAYAGLTMEAELLALDKALGNPKKPVAALVGGAKVSTKLALLGNLVSRVQMLIIGGGMANTFLAARGINVGKSLCEHDLLDTAREIEARAKTAGCRIILPVDAVVAKEFKAGANHRIVDVHDVAADEMILDAGPKSVAAVNAALATARTLVWNGPMGAFEIAPFDTGTIAVAREAARLTRAGTLVSVAGGGDTVSALNHAGVAEAFTYVSTAGGAFLEWMEGKELPGVKALG
ncbi:MAG: phosphoglycerate kinase [Methylocystis sp.]|nr:phosphoglycerate kinase [Methylocystis sp.]MCA3582302.1 phosphoglycerate kinase [Methylocystis sp.]MCA3588197.1 phosphoglycerate kinase [Methylocystis sp.]MCA3590115.1 phosphoglycerate kinase [Methylocystis sp.]